MYTLNRSRYSTHSVISRLVGKNKTVLDVGCNTGYLGSITHSSNIFYGIDIKRRDILMARKVYAKAEQYDLNKLQQLPWKIRFDTIIFADVLEHVTEPDMVLSYFSDQYLKNNGTIIISVPNVANWEIRLKLLFGFFTYTDIGIMDKSHYHFYTFKTACLLVQRNRLTIDTLTYGSSVFGGILRIMPFLKSLLATNIVIRCRKQS